MPADVPIMIPGGAPGSDALEVRVPYDGSPITSVAMADWNAVDQALDTAMHASANLDASAVMINDHTAFRVDWMPFAGLRQSGLGVGGIPITMKDMQYEKMLVIRSNGL